MISSSREDTMLKRTVSSFCCACGAGEKKKNTSLIYSKADSGMCCKDKAVRGAMY